jgi:hypothetical protein
MFLLWMCVGNLSGNGFDSLFICKVQIFSVFRLLVFLKSDCSYVVYIILISTQYGFDGENTSQAVFVCIVFCFRVNSI